MYFKLPFILLFLFYTWIWLVDDSYRNVDYFDLAFDPHLSTYDPPWMPQSLCSKRIAENLVPAKTMVKLWCLPWTMVS